MDKNRYSNSTSRHNTPIEQIVNQYRNLSILPAKLQQDIYARRDRQEELRELREVTLKTGLELLNEKPAQNNYSSGSEDNNNNNNYITPPHDKFKEIEGGGPTEKGFTHTENIPYTSVLPNPSNTDEGYARGMGEVQTPKPTYYNTIAPTNIMGGEKYGGLGGGNEGGEKHPKSTLVHL